MQRLQTRLRVHCLHPLGETVLALSQDIICARPIFTAAIPIAKANVDRFGVIERMVLPGAPLAVEIRRDGLPGIPSK